MSNRDWVHIENCTISHTTEKAVRVRLPCGRDCFAAKAELIRVQCGVASNRSSCCGGEAFVYNACGGRVDCPVCRGTGGRDRELIESHAAWRRLACRSCAGVGRIYGYGETCKVCRGTGDLLVADRTEPSGLSSRSPRSLRWDRGFIGGIELPMNMVFEDATVSVPSAFVRELLGRLPLLNRVSVAGFMPNDATFGNEASWYFTNGDSPGNYRHWLPGVLFGKMYDLYPEGRFVTWHKHWFDNRFCVVSVAGDTPVLTALDMLAVTTAAWARKFVG